MERKVILSIDGVTKVFGGLTAVNDLSLQIHKAEIVALIGPNGSGKSTTLNIISGLYSPEKGRIVFEDTDIQGLPPYRIVDSGLRRTFQNIRLFKDLSIIKNVMIGAHPCGKANVLNSVFKTKRIREEEEKIETIAYDCLKFVGLDVDPKVKAGSLAYGQCRLLEIARALASSPRLLMLDETAAGLNPSEKQNMINIINRIRDKGISILFVEHDMSMVMKVADRIAVLNFGSKIAEGTKKEIQNDPLVLTAYLGDHYVKTE